MAECIFCQIVAGAAPCHKVHEDDATMTFMDLFPVSPGHTLVITKAHYSDLFEAPPEAIAAVGRRSVQLALAIREAFRPDGLGVHQLNGAAAGQTVFHYHMHLMPRWQGGGLQLHSRIQGQADELAEAARRIAACLR